MIFRLVSTRHSEPRSTRSIVRTETPARRASSALDISCSSRRRWTSLRLPRAIAPSGNAPRAASIPAKTPQDNSWVLLLHPCLIRLLGVYVGPRWWVRPASSQLALGIRVDPVLLDLVEERAVADLEQLRGPGAVSLGPAQCCTDVALLE